MEILALENSNENEPDDDCGGSSGDHYENNEAKVIDQSKAKNNEPLVIEQSKAHQYNFKKESPNVSLFDVNAKFYGLGKYANMHANDYWTAML